MCNRLYPLGHKSTARAVHLCVYSFTLFTQGILFHVVSVYLSVLPLFMPDLHVQEFLPKLTGLKWLHSGAVGLEHLLSPALVSSNIVMTNARSVYNYSLSE